MFGHESLPSMVISFGAKRPVVREAYDDQASKAHRYRNVLVEIERARRESARAAVRQASPELLRLEAAADQSAKELDELKASAGKLRSSARSKSAVPPELKQRISDARDALKSLRAQAKSVRAEVYADAEMKRTLKRIDAEAHEKLKAARAASGLYHGTYLAVEDAAQKARRAKFDPKFQRWTGDAKIGTQVQGGCTFAEALSGTDTRLRISILPGGSNKPHAIIGVRIGSDNRKPVWCEHRVRLHRAIPGDAKIKWAYCLRRRVGATEHWYVQLTVSRAGGFGDDPRRATSGRVGIDLGWRLVADGMRVATWRGDDGASGELVIPTARIEHAGRSDSIRSIRDELFNGTRDTLLAHLRGEPIPRWLLDRREYLLRRGADTEAIDSLIGGWDERPILSDELAERIKTAHVWRSQSRLASLVLWWREHRFDADGPIFQFIEEWRKKDKHLWNYEAHSRRKFAAWRREQYRLFAVTLRRRYAVAVIEDTDWRNLARLPDIGKDEAENETARRNRVIASPGFLAQCIREFGPKCEKASAVNTTRTCHACGHAEAFDAARSIMRTCPKCGAVWDQDDNAARNLLASGEVAR